jgi:cell division protein FtsB
MPSSRNTPGPLDRPAAAGSAGAPSDDPASRPEAPQVDATPASDGVDLSALSIAGITRRRVAWVAGGLVSAWIVIIFARQTGDAATAASRVDQMVEENRALAAEVASLQQELTTIEQPAYIGQQARAYRIGTDKEVPFTMDRSVAPPGPDAPGSAALSLGARDRTMTPLESWLSLLFGPSN